MPSQVCLADLKGDESNHRKVKLKCEEVQGRDLLLNFHGTALLLVEKPKRPLRCILPPPPLRAPLGLLFNSPLPSPSPLPPLPGMDLTTDKLRSLIKKWQTLIEAFVDAKTTDGYVLRLFSIGFTRKNPGSTRKTCYCQSSQAKAIRGKMVEIMSAEASNCDLRELVKKLSADSISDNIVKACEVRAAWAAWANW